MSLTRTQRYVLAGVAAWWLLLRSAPNKKIPTGYCIDRKTGKPRAPSPPCDKHGRGVVIGIDRNGRPIYSLCDKKGDCVPQLLDDPLTHLTKQLAPIAVVVALAVVAFRKR